MQQEFITTKKGSIFAVSLALFFFFGFYAGNHSQAKTVQSTNLTQSEMSAINADFAPFWKVWKTINEKFPNAGEVTNQERIYGAINGLVGSLDDPYSVFFEPEEAKMFEEDISGNFSGVGMEVGKRNGSMTVIAPLKNTPAEKAGIKAGDMIIKIDVENTLDMSVEKAVKLIRGESGTDVVITILREGEDKPREIKITRAIINIPTLDTELRKDGIFVIRLYSFSANSANLFRNAIRDFKKTKSDKLLLDLRGNPGGYLNSAVDMASWFLDSSKTVVIEDYGGEIDPKIYRSRGYDLFDEKLKFIILIDGGSASASEILAGAMQDYGIAKLVGDKSYGKGSVQEVTNVTPDTIFKVTVAKWLTPNKKMIDKTGLTPDYLVPNTAKDRDAKLDPQMNKAVELLNNWK